MTVCLFVYLFVEGLHNYWLNLNDKMRWGWYEIDSITFSESSRSPPGYQRYQRSIFSHLLIIEPFCFRKERYGSDLNCTCLVRGLPSLSALIIIYLQPESTVEILAYTSGSIEFQLFIKCYNLVCFDK